MKIALTGSIGVGKSEVFKIIKDIEKNRAQYIDLDEVTRELYNDEEILIELENLFNTRNKQEISNIVFNDEKKLKELNKFMHAKILYKMKHIMKNSQKEKFYIDIPLLYEVNWENLFDKIIVVYSPKEKQLERIVKRNNMSKEEALNRIDSQIDIEEKRKRSEYIIDNSSDGLENLYLNTLEIIMKIRKESKC